MKSSSKNRTKIVATLGPSTDDPDTLVNLMLAGVDVVRVNFSHGPAEIQAERIERVRRLASEAGRHIGIDTQGTIVRADGQHLIVTVGLEDCIVVHTPDATLVARKECEEQVRQVAEKLKEQGWDEYL